MKTCHSHKLCGESGFSLIELAISLVVIGLLLGAVLKGRDIVDNIQVHQTVKHLKLIDMAVKVFFERYDALPGELDNPTQYIPNCTGACASGGWIEQLQALDLVTVKYPGSLIETVSPLTNVLERDLARGKLGKKFTTNEIPAKALESIDKLSDDGNLDKGRVGKNSGGGLVCKFGTDSSGLRHDHVCVLEYHL